MATLYSSRLFEIGPSGGGGSESFTVPDGFVWVVTSINATNTSDIGTGLLGFSVQRVGGVVLWNVDNLQAVSGLSYQWEGRAVYNPGEEIQVTWNDGFWSISSSGFQLSLP